METKMTCKEKIRDFFSFPDWIRTLRSVPGLTIGLLLAANVLMNILANKSIIELKFPDSDSYWLIQDAGIFFSWIAFLIGDLLVKNFGAKNAIRVNVTCIILSLFLSLLLALAGLVPGTWSSEFNYPDARIQQDVSDALNSTISNAWYVILGSALASLVGLITNNLTDEVILKKIEKKHGDHYWGYITASGISTFIGQILDNLIFALVISVHFFKWTYLTAFMCSLDGALFELIIQMIFTPLSYAISKNWKKNGIGTNNIRKAKDEAR